jgi:5-(carboxyamino)imidazole ribonucleotide synthase
MKSPTQFRSLFYWASYTSQFENHVRAILNLPLGNTDSKVAGIMVNLVGEEGFQVK